VELLRPLAVVMAKVGAAQFGVRGYGQPLLLGDSAFPCSAVFRGPGEDLAGRVLRSQSSGFSRSLIRSLIRLRSRASAEIHQEQPSRVTDCPGLG
jgi:hypothetical protein